MREYYKVVIVIISTIDLKFKIKQTYGAFSTAGTIFSIRYLIGNFSYISLTASVIKCSGLFKKLLFSLCKCFVVRDRTQTIGFQGQLMSIFCIGISINTFGTIHLLAMSSRRSLVLSFYFKFDFSKPSTCSFSSVKTQACVYFREWVCQLLLNIKGLQILALRLQI